MNSSDHPWHVCRRLFLNVSIPPVPKEVNTNDDEKRVTHLLRNLAGVVEISAIEKDQLNHLRITVCYDQRKIDFMTLHQRLLASGFHPVDTLWQCIRKGFYQYLDSNSRDMANRRPSPCCSNPTEILSRSRRNRR